jgi:archaellum component FlaC
MPEESTKDEKDPVQKIFTWVKIIGSTIPVLIAIFGFFVSYISSSLVSKDSFSSYREESLKSQNEFQIKLIEKSSETIKDSLKPISDKMTKIDNKVDAVEKRVEQLSSIISGSDLVRSKDYNDFVTKSAVEKERLSVLVSSIQKELRYLSVSVPSKDQYDFLRSEIEGLEKKLEELSKLLAQKNIES